MSERESHEQPQAPGSGEGSESAASFPFGAARWADCCGPAMTKMAAACRGEPEESKPPAHASGGTPGAGSD
jgi:hypothetical protein